jgi:hypothetical protein
MAANGEKPTDVELHHMERYRRAAHAMMSGVKHEMESYQGGLSPDTTPKMLRTGVNSALVESSMIGQLLVEKGIITREEYLRRVADAMEKEAQRYEELLSLKFGRKVQLDWRDI